MINDQEIHNAIYEFPYKLYPVMSLLITEEVFPELVVQVLQIRIKSPA